MTEGDELDRVTIAMMRGADLLRIARRRDVAIVPGLEPIHLEVMSCLNRLGPTALSRIASETVTQLSTVSRRVTRLEELGLVAKQADEHDRRVQVAELTAAGREAMQAVEAQRRQMVVRALEGWTAEEVRDLRTMLARLADGMEQPG